MYIISVINYKGGVGKTTITANLGAELAWRGRRVLLIDIDPQASLTFSFISPEKWVRTYSESKTLKTWFQSYEENQPISLKDIIFTPPKTEQKLKELGAKGRLDLISSHLELINIDLELAIKLGGATLKEIKRNYLKVHGMLSRDIKQIEKERYDFVLIDCPPNFNIVTKTAIVASDYLLIPAKADYLSTIGIDYLIKSYSSLVSDYNDYVRFGEHSDYSPISPLILGVVFNMIQVYGGGPIAVLREYMEKTGKLGIPVFQNYVRAFVVFCNAPAYGLPVILKDHNFENPSIIIAEEIIKNFVNEFETKLGTSIR